LLARCSVSGLDSVGSLPLAADQRHRPARDGRARHPRAGSDPSIRLTRRRRPRQDGARRPTAAADVRIAVGAGRGAHRPALRSPTRPARVLSCAASARVGRIARRATLAPTGTSRGRGHAPWRAINMRAKRSQRATHNRAARARPPSLQGLWSFGRLTQITTLDGVVITILRVRQHSG
jgi:hypothetical protein